MRTDGSRRSGDHPSRSRRPGRSEAHGRPLVLAALLAMVGLGWSPAVPAQGPLPAPGRVEQAVQEGIDPAQLLEDIRMLAHDSMAGRRTGTPGNERARRYLLDRFQEIGLESFDGGFARPFEATAPRGGSTLEAVNVVGYVPGAEDPEPVLVVTAHYDHLGERDGAIYNGADDNASGTAGLLALAQHFVDAPPAHTIVFAALDAEEMGLQGARAFVSDPPLPLSRVRMNVNLDMVSRSEVGELYAAGTYHYPGLSELLEAVEPEEGVSLLTGHDRPHLPPADDWTMASDHAAFHERGIPFLYFGVEDHAGYHDPSDVVEDITPDFFISAVETIRKVIRAADARLTELPNGR